MIKIVVIIITFFLLYFFSGSASPVNRSIQNSFASLRGEIKPDTNIIILHITSSDHENIGPWPIKRSYYALLINQLNKLGAKKIGLEIFLSSRVATQTIYDNLLTREISKAGNVVLSSLAGEIYKKEIGNNFYTDSLSFPSPKLINSKIKTGHINFVDDDRLEIPLELINRDEKEEAFSKALSDIKSSQDIIIPNITSGWKQFRNYSLQKFFALVQNEDKTLNVFKDKIIIIGVSDFQIARALNSNFDEQMPGLALHAFALDNLLNNSSLRLIDLPFSLLLSLLIFLPLIFLIDKFNSKKSIIFLLIFFASLLLIFFLLFIFFNMITGYSLFIIPAIVLIFTEIFFFAEEKKAELAVAIDEKEILESHLGKRENELKALQSDLAKLGAENTGEIKIKIKRLEDEIAKLKRSNEDELVAENIEEIPAKNFHGIIYRSKNMEVVTDLIKKTAPENASILILGESGTGKELAARAVHTLSKRSGQNFIAINCGALSDALLESELFGHVKGAFTGAVSDKIGRFEAADKGTIFLDEIAETSESFQVKLLRVLQSGEFEKVGSSKTTKVDVRLVAATNKNIEAAVKEKKFREDLYYRINVIKVELPPLRERKEDIEVIADYIVKKDDENINLSKAALEALINYDWKGNIRELEGVLKRAVIFARSSGRNLIQLSDLPEEIVKKIKFNFEDIILQSLRDKKFSHPSITETANEIGNVSRTVVSENFRGIFFKLFVENDFNAQAAINIISGTEDIEIFEKVKTKCEIFLRNLQKDIQKFPGQSFDDIKTRFSSKYKNLPARFHIYLDEIIKHEISNN